MNDWIEWRGGDLPVPVLQKVEIETREGRRYTNYAGAYIWGHIDFFDDIVRYRIVEKVRE